MFIRGGEDAGVVPVVLVEQAEEPDEVMMELHEEQFEEHGDADQLGEGDQDQPDVILVAVEEEGEDHVLFFF